MIERRAYPRYWSDIDGVLFSGGGATLTDCSIVDLSEGGARVMVHRIASLPKKVLLLENHLGNIYECEVRWRQRSEAGLQFIDIVRRALHRELISMVAEASFGAFFRPRPLYRDLDWNVADALVTPAKAVISGATRSGRAPEQTSRAPWQEKTRAMRAISG